MPAAEGAADDIATTLVDRDDIPVMYVCVPDGLEAIRAAWDRLELQVALRGRKFFGAFYGATSEYWACVQVLDQDDPAALGLEAGTLPGGKYLRARLRGEPPAVFERIGPTFSRLERAADPDPSRPSIEFYRSRDEIDLLMPVTT